MTDWTEDVRDALLALNTGDDVAITTDYESGGLELSGYVVSADHSPAERFDGVWSPGGLDIHVELTDEVVDELEDVDGLERATHSVSIHMKESRPGEWGSSYISMWTPEVGDGGVVEDEYTDLGDITDVEVPDTE